MAKTKSSTAVSTDALKPYVQRAMTDPELREDLLAAFVAARSIYGQMAKGRGLKGKAEKVSEKDFQKQLQSLVGDLSNEELIRGLGIQLLWTLIGLAIFRIAWKHAVKRYSAVGG